MLVELLSLLRPWHCLKGNCKARCIMLKCSDSIYFNEHYIPDEYLILTFSFVEITNSSLSFVNISEKEKREQKQKHHMLRALLLCVLLLNNTDKPRVCYFWLLRQEESSPGITHLRVGEAVAEGQGEGEYLYWTVLRIFFIVRRRFWSQWFGSIFTCSLCQT